jgi:hypothetical protein
MCAIKKKVEEKQNPMRTHSLRAAERDKDKKEETRYVRLPIFFQIELKNQKRHLHHS